MVLNVAGMELPLKENPGGPLLSTSYEKDDPRETLAWVVNTAVTGGLPGLEEALSRRERLVIPQGMSVSPVEPEDITPAEELRWLRLGRSLLEGEEVWRLTTTFTPSSLVMPGRVLLEVFRKLSELRRTEG
ncbi:hypothetical protein ACLESO_31535 [Pyxidicoccus sp. 3LG]